MCAVYIHYIPSTERKNRYFGPIPQGLFGVPVESVDTLSGLMASRRAEAHNLKITDNTHLELLLRAITQIAVIFITFSCTARIWNLLRSAQLSRPRASHS